MDSLINKLRFVFWAGSKEPAQKISPESEKDYLEEFFALEDKVAKNLLPYFMIKAVSLTESLERSEYFVRLIEYLNVDFSDPLGVDNLLKERLAGKVNLYSSSEANAICEWLEYVVKNYPHEIDLEEAGTAIAYWKRQSLL